MAKHLYLAKASDALISHCRCDSADALIASPAQMDCPWCGCGWLFVCIRCSKAFAFARGVEVEESWEATADRDLRKSWRRAPTAAEIGEWIGLMGVFLREVELGKEYVYLDGLVVPALAKSITMEGQHSRHALPFVPQVAAMSDPAVDRDVLSNEHYWASTSIDQRGLA